MPHRLTAPGPPSSTCYGVARKILATAAPADRAAGLTEMPGGVRSQVFELSSQRVDVLRGLRASGASYRQIGILLGVSKIRVQQLCICLEQQRSESVGQV